MLENLERDRVGDGSRERAHNGPSFAPVATVAIIAPIAVVPVDTIWIDDERSDRWERAKLVEGDCILFVWGTVETLCIEVGFDGGHTSRRRFTHTRPRSLALAGMSGELRTRGMVSNHIRILLGAYAGADAIRILRECDAGISRSRCQLGLEEVCGRGAKQCGGDTYQAGTELSGARRRIATQGEGGGLQILSGCDRIGDE